MGAPEPVMQAANAVIDGSSLFFIATAVDLYAQGNWTSVPGERLILPLSQGMMESVVYGGKHGDRTWLCCIPNDTQRHPLHRPDPSHIMRYVTTSFATSAQVSSVQSTPSYYLPRQ